MGVLDYIWTGTSVSKMGAVTPVYRQATLADVDDPTQWWEIPRASPLGKYIRIHYPFLTPEVGESGELVGAKAVREDGGPDPAEDRKALDAEARSRGYARASRATMRKNIMPFLAKGCGV